MYILPHPPPHNSTDDDMPRIPHHPSVFLYSIIIIFMKRTDAVARAGDGGHRRDGRGRGNVGHQGALLPHNPARLGSILGDSRVRTALPHIRTTSLRQGKQAAEGWGRVLEFCPRETHLHHVLFAFQITANLDVFIRRFNEIQYWTVTEIVSTSSLGKRVSLLRKFIKLAA